MRVLFIKRFFCRYLTPGECIIHDRGPEFANSIMRALLEDFGVDVRVISAGRPQANGQVEIMVCKFKEKLRALMSETSNL